MVGMPRQKRNSGPAFNLRFSLEELAVVEKLMQADQRGITDLVRRALAEYAKRFGLEWPSPTIKSAKKSEAPVVVPPTLDPPETRKVRRTAYRANKEPECE